ncbi:pyridoxal phosphate-dependent transferase [Mariannaea sp. PMI_226]|nr:pyridoxal phosphate-dependent transferase [Mariannaea sp. PMI_226]
MVVLRPQSEFGHAPPPQTPYSIITNLPTWANAKAFRDGDSSAMAKVVHVYPRLMPMQFVAQLEREILKKLGIQGKKAFIYLNPSIWPYTQRHITLPGRGPFRMTADEIELKVVDIAGHRLYVVIYDPKKTPGILLTWGNPGVGLSIRGAEEILSGLDDLKEVPYSGTGELPPPTWTPEGPAHQGLRERVNELLHRAPIDPANVTCTPSDVFLYPSGMGAIYDTFNRLVEYRPGTAVMLGIPFHNTYHHILEEASMGIKHFGRVDQEGIDSFESWLEEEKQNGKPVSYAFVEIPGNPTLDTVDVARLKRLSEKFGFVLVVDDTVAGFANVDVFAQGDILLTSLTKSFNGQADALGGSIVLNPLSPHYDGLAAIFKATYRNELFASEAAVLLANSHDFIQRTAVLNRNAEAMANFLQGAKSIPNSPIINVQYPSLLPSKPNYDAIKRPATPELPNPGYGCLLTVEFDCVESAIAFYDRCGFYPSPHLGGHVSLVFPYNMLVFTKKPAEAAYMRELGVKEESVRISSGLEKEEDLIDTLKDALDAAIKTKEMPN